MARRQNPKLKPGAGVAALPDWPEVRVGRDVTGAVIVQAPDERQAAVGLGWLHAEDRLTQMILTRTAAEGRTAELLDHAPELVALDRLMRQLNLRAGLDDEIALLAPDIRAQVDGYCDGVNRWIATHRRPLDLTLVGLRPEPWRPTDLGLVIKLMSFLGLLQTQAEMEKGLVQAVQAGVSGEKLRDLFGPALDGIDLDLLRGVRLAPPLPAPVWSLLGRLPQALASNNWVVSPRKSATGHALFANDPHLEIGRLPAIWAEATIRLPDEQIQGATLPGVPGVVAGRNRRLAWGITYSFMDACDYVVERCEAGKIRRGEGFVQPTERRETILRKGAEPLQVSYFETDLGVIEGDPRVSGDLLAFCWVGNRAPLAASITGILRTQTAASVDEAIPLLREVALPSLVWALADDAGHIGLQTAGAVPQRKPGWSGLYPVAAWEPEHRWRGLVPPEELPVERDPERGFCASANHPVTLPGAPILANLTMPSYRLDRITETLAASDHLTLDEFRRLQLDTVSLRVRAFKPRLLDRLPTGPERDLLAAWDGAYSADSHAATLFERLHRSLIETVFGPGLGAATLTHLIDDTPLVRLYGGLFDRILLADNSPWFDGRSWQTLYDKAIAHALATGPAEPWGAQRKVWLRHLVLGGRLPSWLGFDAGPMTFGSSSESVQQHTLGRLAGRGFSVGPSIRLIADLGSDALWTALPGGPSGRRFSRLYTSDLPRYLAGRLKQLGADQPTEWTG